MEEAWEWFIRELSTNAVSNPKKYREEFLKVYNPRSRENKEALARLIDNIIKKERLPRDIIHSKALRQPITIDFFLEKYRDNIPMIESLFQWASLGFGLAKNQLKKLRKLNYILSTLQRRSTSIGDKDFSTVEEEYQGVSDWLITRPGASEKFREELESIRAEISSQYGERLRQLVLERLEGLNIEGKKIVLACLKTVALDRESIKQRGKRKIWSFYSLGEPRILRGGEEEAKLTAFCFAALSPSIQQVPILDLLEEVGVLNPIVSVSWRGNESSEYEFPRYLVPLADNVDNIIDAQSLNLPSIASYIWLLSERGDYRQMRLLDKLVSQGCLPMPEAHEYIKPIEGAIGIHGGVVAVSPLVIGELERSIREAKEALTSEMKVHLKQIFRKLKEKYQYGLEINFSQKDGAMWLVELENAQILSVRLSPWMLNRDVDSLDTIYSHILIITNQSLPSLTRLLGRARGRVTLLLLRGKTIVQRMLGSRHPLLGEILSKFRDKGFIIVNGE